MIPPLFRLSRSALIRLLLLLAAGGLFTGWMVMRADRALSADLLQHTRAVAQAVNLEQVRALSGAATDLDQPAYRRLKEQLLTIRATFPECRFLYLLGQKPDGTVFIFVDSESPSSKDHSPPGQVYTEVPAAFRRAFDAPAAVVAGPVADRWGVWVSGLVPLTDPQTGRVLTVLGMDIDAGPWRWRVAERAVLPVGLLLVLVTGAALVWHHARRPHTRRNLAAALGLLAVGLLVTGVAAHFAKLDVEGDAQREFDIAGDEIRLNLLARLRACSQVLLSGAATFDASDSVQRADWRAFTQGLELDAELPGIQGVGYAQWFPRAQLAAHVAEIHQLQFFPLEILHL